MSQEFEQSVITAGKVVSYAGAGTTVISGLTLSEWGVVIGIVCWVVSTALTGFFTWRKNAREKLEMRQRMRYRRRAMRAMQAGKWATWQDPEDLLGERGGCSDE